MGLWGWLVQPFVEFGFMQNALLGCVLLSVSAAPVGVFLMLRRMSLTGDAMAHGILPGAAVGYLYAGLSLGAMTVGGLLAGVAVAVASGLVARHTVLREDTSLAAFYLLSLSLGVLIVSTKGNNVDLLHVLFGTVLALDDAALWLLGGVATVTVATLLLLFRPLVLECLDPAFLRSVSGWSPVAHYGFLVLLVLNLVAGFHALGTLMAVGLVVLPGAAARFWVRDIRPLLGLSAVLALVGSVAGLLVSYHADLPSGPAIVLALSVLMLASLVAGPFGVLRSRLQPARHLRA
ncbi:MAG TPA: metal ABC transporter permease [Burkholderiaceae bacterium]|nr:metal ABC transporter permease [Burkholderiaceae bacterium]